MNYENQDLLEAKRIKVIFLYNFILIFEKEFREIRSLLHDKGYQDIELARDVSPKKFESIIKLRKEVATFQSKILPKGTKVKPELTGLKQKKFRITGEITILSSGIGTYLLELSSEEKLKTKEIIVLSNLAEEGQRLVKNIAWKNSAFEIFYKEISKFASAARGTWLEVKPKETMLGLEEIIEENTFQNPYVCIYVEMDKEDYKTNFRDAQTHKYDNEIMGMLLRLLEPGHYQNLDPEYLSKYAESHEGKLTNMFPNASFFLHFTLRASVAIGNENLYPVEMILRSLLRTLGYLRSRWYSYTIANYILGQQIQSIKRDYDEIAKKKRIPVETSLDESQRILDNLIHSRAIVTRFLEDLLGHEMASASLNLLYTYGLRAFRVEELERIIMAKLETLSKVYDYLMHYIRVRGLKESKFEEAR